jgi:bile acid:Na+ symporter, BASS family
VPVGMLAGQLSLLLIVPVLTGMGLRHQWPNVAARHGRTLLGASIAALAAIMAMIIAQEREQFAHHLGEIVVATAVLSVLAFGTGWLIGWLSAGGASDRFTVGMVFVVRNVGIATAIAVTVLGRAEFAVFATAYFLAQAPMLLVAVVLFRYLRAGAQNNLTEAIPQ